MNKKIVDFLEHTNFGAKTNVGERKILEFDKDRGGNSFGANKFVTTKFFRVEICLE